ncbi:MAG: ParB/RepB/Spo0J family partition protein [Pseudooceanicola nanhaiensis]
MAKRKRLSPADPERIRAPETKGMFSDAPVGKVPDHVLRPRPAPIAEVAAGAASAAALDEMAQTWSEAREGGRLVVALPHDAIRLDHIVRDRMAEDPEEAETLKESLKRRGQQTPVEVVALADGGYGLLSGWRRCRALAALHAETGEERFASVQALLRRPADAPAAYTAMVEENEIRANLSHYERARIVVKAAGDGVFGTEREALRQLFAAVPRARRSKIGSFLPIVHALDGTLRFPAALTERAGLALAQAMQADPQAGARLRAALEAAAPPDAAAEQAVIAAFLSGPEPDAAGENGSEPPRKGEETAAPEVLGDWPGLRVTAREGRITLSGAAVDPALAEDLMAWLSGRMV